MSTNKDPFPNMADRVYGPKSPNAKNRPFSANSADLDYFRNILTEIRFISNFVDENWVQKRLNEIVNEGFRQLSER